MLNGFVTALNTLALRSLSLATASSAACLLAVDSTNPGAGLLSISASTE